MKCSFAKLWAFFQLDSGNIIASEDGVQPPGGDENIEQSVQMRTTHSASNWLLIALPQSPGVGEVKVAPGEDACHVRE